MTGVYTIYNVITKKYYVGSTSKSFKYRFAEHKRTLRDNIHRNGRLQNSWNKYGVNAFEFEILEETEPNTCLASEQYWIDLLCTYDDKHGYNIARIAGSSFGQRRTPEQKLNISLSVKGKREGILNNNYGKRITADQIDTQRKSCPHVKPVQQLDINNILLAEFSSTRHAENETGVDRSQISKVCRKMKKYTTAGGYKWTYKIDYDG